MKLIILDRDGVINFDSDKFIRSPEDWKPIPGSLEAIARLNHEGYRVIIASNQSGIGRGLLDMATLNAIHSKMHKALMSVGGQIDAIFLCPHPADIECDCRKPRTGLFSQISERFHVSLAGIPAIGDSLRDLQAAEMAGASPKLVLTGKGAKTLESGGLPAGTEVFDDLARAVDDLLRRSAGVQ
jgi:D-glycero-D-manno-heptose 1,7-bisphosphate phosphatase